ncbi:uncharacterized protein A1O9_07503 [Exophiala aquamarina CBS 119918]|uniref:Alcohol dehydrogenase n=1 Tax=Exophiala aquamarina CBS 119918 TaxID=1182545 RepID=A0A072P9H5_9EURO|nr:uncharacterized protein A1O9_07503 [Exophiala aquamarina CBS 119918]KEF55923.1 hypothetical protein A1O9_07503 [Exophiala aquamarina CBS 119918]
MKVSVEGAQQLATVALRKLGYNAADTKIIADHLIDSELRGYGIAGLARILSIGERLGGKVPSHASEVTKDEATTAQIDGRDTLGYLVAHKATEVAIQKAKTMGVAAIGANNTYYTGMLSYYAEMAAAQDLVTIIASNTSPWVAPEGTHKALLGTNPFCVGIPTNDVPIIYDIGTSRIIHAQVLLAQRTGKPLPPDTAFDADGNSTTDPAAALEGALAIWGGAKGSGLAIAVQLLGVLAGSPALPPNLEDFGYFIIAVDPARFRPIDEFKREVGTLVDAFHAAPASGGLGSLRLPFERSNRVRDQTRADGGFEVDEVVLEKLKALVDDS